MHYDKKYLVFGLSYVIAGMGLGIVMAATNDHEQRITHAHLNLVGFVVSLIYAVIHKLWLSEKPSVLAKVQFLLHNAGAIAMIVGLFLLFNHSFPEASLEPVLKASSVAVLIAAILMLVMVFKLGKKSG